MPDRKEKVISFLDHIKNKKIAVVGNADSLLSSCYGNSIDNHDVVIRINKCANLMYINDYTVEKACGTKFDFWAFWAGGAFYNSTIKNDNCTKEIKDYFLNGKKNIKKIEINTNGHKSITNKYIDYTMPTSIYSDLTSQLNLLSSTKVTPSTGIAILEWLRIGSPSRVSIYGMDFKKTPTFSEKQRYKEDMIGQYDSRCKHDYCAEEQYIKNVILKDKRFQLFL